MRPEEYSIYITRVQKFYDHLAKGAPLVAKVPFSAEFAHSVEPVPFAKRLSGSYKPIKQGEVWGEAWDSAWFRLKATVPAEWAGRKIVGNINLNGEALVFGADGCPLFGLTNGSVFSINYGKDVYYITDKCKGGEEIELWVEAAANHLFGITQDQDPARSCPKRHGEYTGKVVSLDLALFDDNLWHLLLDVKVLFSLLKGLSVGSKDANAGNMWGSGKKLLQLTPRQKRILHRLNKAIDAYADNPANAAKAREVLKPLFAGGANASDTQVVAVGHAHIDTGWLWPVRESIRKSARTFASQIALMEKYPGYVFGASQPQHYQFVKDNYPALYEKMKKYIKNGQWECQGGMWVEADCNVTGGESMVRQFVHGKNFFKDEFGVDVKNLWIPDVFGYSAAMPQIMKKSGVDFFLTQKISWSQFNEFPHNTFRWRGIDGSEVVTHFPPEDSYNSEMIPEKQIFAQNNFKESHLLDECMCLYGIGNGGGGPKEEHVEQALRQADLEGCPKVRFGRADEFFAALSKHADALELWSGELYLELHRATLTTQARTKKGNRTLERKLREAEFVCSCLPLAEYPQAALDRIWKTLLINQFHDILPGSSIRKVYEVTEREYAECIAECDELIAQAGKRLLSACGECLTLVNPLAYEFNAPVVLPQDWAGCAVQTASGKPLPVQQDENGAVVLASIPPCSALEIRKAGSAPATAETSGLVLENGLIRYEFAQDGTIISAFDKEAGREIISKGEKGNLLSLYIDRPVNWDAWDIDITYENELAETARALKAIPLAAGPARKGLKFILAIGVSQIEQSVYLNENSKRLDFNTRVNWHETHRMLRVSFPVDIFTQEATYDIQYGYARRANTRNTSWELAKFEVPAQKYVDLSERSYGVALLNDCKYGHKIIGSVIDLNLLRAPVYPDADADLGEHTFTYSLLPHCGDLLDSGVLEQAAMLNQPPVIIRGGGADKLGIPVSFSGDGVSLEVLKKAEKSNEHVLRLVETRGCVSECSLVLNKGGKLVQTNLLEWTNEGELQGKEHSLSLQPFEIRTYIVKS